MLLAFEDELFQVASWQYFFDDFYDDDFFAVLVFGLHDFFVNDLFTAVMALLDAMAVVAQHFRVVFRGIKTMTAHSASLGIADSEHGAYAQGCQDR